MNSRVVAVVALVLACAYAPVHGSTCSSLSPKFPYEGDAIVTSQGKWGYGACNPHPWYGQLQCTIPSANGYPKRDHVTQVTCSNGVANPPPQAVKKELLQVEGPRTFGPRVTDCNQCFFMYPPIRQSCSAYAQWKKVQECVDTLPVSLLDANGNERFYAANTNLSVNACDEIEIAMAAGACMVRNTISKSDACMSSDDCTKFMNDISRMSKTKPSFDNEATNNFPDCDGVGDWFNNPPACSDSVAMKKIDNCLLNEASQAKWNNVAKGYVRAWYEEYYYRVCKGEYHHNKMSAMNSQMYSSSGEESRFHPDFWRYTDEEREKQNIVVKGLNWN